MTLAALRGWVVAVVWLLTLAPLQAQQKGAENSRDPQLIVTIDPQDVATAGAYIHGQIVVRVVLMSPYPYEALELTVPDIDGAKKVELQRSRSRQAETYSGTRFILETAFALFPTRRGPLRVAPVKAEGLVAGDEGDVAFSVSNAEIVLDVDGADQRYEDPWWLVAENVEITETWSKPLEEVRVGDTVQRDIQVVAKGTTAEHLPELEHGRMRGVRATKIGQSSETSTTISGAIATLNQSWLLTFDHQDVSYIAPLGVAYWDQRQGLRKKASIPIRRLELLPEDSALRARQLMDEAHAESQRSRVLAMSLVVIGLMPVFALACAWGIAVLPTMADLRLARVLNGRGTDAPDDLTIYRAVDLWARASGVAKGEDRRTVGPPLEIVTLQRKLFADNGPGERTPMSIWGFLSYSRRHRLSRLQDRLSAIWGKWLTP